MFRHFGWVGIAFLLAVAACARSASPTPSSAPHAPQRIVTLAPSLTETVFALGLGDRIVGVTSDSEFPAETQQKTKLGGFLTINAEAVVALEPDLILIPPTTGDMPEHLRKLGLPCALVHQFSVEDILASITQIGSLCKAESAAKSLRESIEMQLRHVQDLTKDLPKPRVLISVGRDYTSTSLDQVYIAAGTSFYAGLVELAGGENAYQSQAFAYPMLSAEGIMELAPDVVLEILPDREKQSLAPETILAAWQSLPELPAVRDGRIFTLDANYIGIPGPRMPLILNDMAAKLHPEVSF